MENEEDVPTERMWKKIEYSPVNNFRTKLILDSFEQVWQQLLLASKQDLTYNRKTVCEKERKIE